MPTELYERQVASGFTHFQQSGTGAIRKYYNYFRVTPMLEPLDALGYESLDALTAAADAVPGLLRSVIVRSRRGRALGGGHGVG